jgi:hypothetical protein
MTKGINDLFRPLQPLPCATNRVIAGDVGRYPMFSTLDFFLGEKCGLAAQQGVMPVNDLDELAALWPVDDDPDALLSFILEERSQRRRQI